MLLLDEFASEPLLPAVVVVVVLLRFAEAVVMQEAERMAKLVL